jgi:hypothetical protein
VFVATAVITFSPWLIRNAVWTGNPVFPEATSLFGRGPFSPSQQTRWVLAHAPRQDQSSLAARLRAFAEQNLVDWRYGFVVLPAGLVAGALNRRRPEMLLLTSLLMLQAIVWVGFTHLQGRFFVLSIPMVAIGAGLVELVWWRWVVVGAAGVAIAVSLTHLVPRVMRFSPLLGLEDYRLILPDALSSEILDSGRPIVLAGDAQAFRYPVPMSRLRYRTVFDVDARPGQSVIDAWIDEDVPDDAVIIVDPESLRRFAQTYWGIPPFQGTQTRMFIFEASSRVCP